MMICKNCGTENSESAKFCKNCGTSLQDITGYDASGITGNTDNNAETSGVENVAAGADNGVPGGPGNSINGAYSQAGSNANNSMYNTPPNSAYNPGNSDATASLIMGIISIVMCSSSLLAIGLGIAAIVLANKAIRQGAVGGNASAGRICGIIGICLSSISTIYYIVMFFVGIVTAVYH